VEDSWEALYKGMSTTPKELPTIKTTGVTEPVKTTDSWESLYTGLTAPKEVTMVKAPETKTPTKRVDPWESLYKGMTTKEPTIQITEESSGFNLRERPVADQLSLLRQAMFERKGKPIYPQKKAKTTEKFVYRDGQKYREVKGGGGNGEIELELVKEKVVERPEKIKEKIVEKQKPGITLELGRQKEVIKERGGIIKQREKTLELGDIKVLETTKHREILGERVKEKGSIIERIRERQKEQERVREKEREREREREQSRQKEREREREREREKEGTKTLEREREREREKLKQREREREKEVTVTRQREREIEKVKQKEREREREVTTQKERIIETPKIKIIPGGFPSFSGGPGAESRRLRSKKFTKTLAVGEGVGWINIFNQPKPQPKPQPRKRKR
jgi:hypothetical protein